MLGSDRRAKKSLGQNFLINDRVIERIVAEGLPADNSFPLVEIGPGPGALTRELIKRNQPLWVVELDREKVAILEREFAAENIVILNMDALKLNLAELWGEQKGWLIGNLPYYITNPLLRHFLAQKDSLFGLTVMVQKEVADRMLARPGGKEYGLLSIVVQLAAEPRKLFEVPATAFYPRPKVKSAVVKLSLRPYPGLEIEEEVLIKVAKAAFAQRRKTLLNTLSAGLDLSKGDVANVLRLAGIEQNRRAEELSILDYQKICQTLQNFGLIGGT